MTTDKFLSIVYPNDWPFEVEVCTVTPSLRKVTLYKGSAPDLPDILRYAEVQDADLTAVSPVLVIA